MSESKDAVRLVSESTIVADLKRRFETALAPVLALSNEAADHQINVALQFSRDAFGRLQLSAKLMKEL